ncbi:MAG: lipase family protein [Magnetococcus sp. DMHC-8]
MNRITLAIAANMAALVYDTTAQLPDFAVTQHLHGNIQWLAARNADALWIVFRGTDELADWVDNLDVAKTVSAQGYVHKGFANAIDRVWRFVLDEVYAQEIRHLHFVGHSLGGALAAIAASRCLLGVLGNRIQLWTFGQPRCGDKRWADWMDERLGQRYVRVFNAGDIVPHLPTFMRFRHAGTEVFFDEHGKVATPTFLHRVTAAVEVIRTQLPSSILRFGAHSMGRYRDNVFRMPS